MPLPRVEALGSQGGCFTFVGSLGGQICAVTAGVPAPAEGSLGSALCIPQPKYKAAILSHASPRCHNGAGEGLKGGHGAVPGLGAEQRLRCLIYSPLAYIRCVCHLCKSSRSCWDDFPRENSAFHHQGEFASRQHCLLLPCTPAAHAARPSPALPSAPALLGFSSWGQISRSFPSTVGLPSHPLGPSRAAPPGSRAPPAPGHLNCPAIAQPLLCDGLGKTPPARSCGRREILKHLGRPRAAW